MIDFTVRFTFGLCFSDGLYEYVPLVLRYPFDASSHHPSLSTTKHYELYKAPLTYTTSYAQLTNDFSHHTKLSLSLSVTLAISFTANFC